MKKQLIFPKNKYWRKQEALCGILNEWYGEKNASRIIGELCSQPQPIQKFIEKILASDNSPAEIEFQKTKIAWNKIVPPEFNKSAYPFYIKNKTLYVKVKDSCSLMELKMREKEILKKLLTELKNASFSKIHFTA